VARRVNAIHNRAFSEPGRGQQFKHGGCLTHRGSQAEGNRWHSDNTSEHHQMMPTAWRFAAGWCDQSEGVAWLADRRQAVGKGRPRSTCDTTAWESWA